MFRFNKIINIFIIFIFISSCSSSNDDKKIVKPKNKVDLPVLYSSAMQDLNDGKNENAVKKFKMVEKDYSFTEWGPKSILMQSYVYYIGNKPADAVVTLDRYIKSYPNNSDRIYADYLKAIISFDYINDPQKDQTRTLEALRQFKLLIGKYPNTEYAKDAKYKIDLLNDNLAAKEMYLGRYYMDQKKWAAALSRFMTVIEKYQTTIYIEEALYRMVEIYHKLGLTEESNRAAALLGYNYNSSEWYKKSYFLITNQQDLPKIKKDNFLLNNFKKIFN